MRPRLVGIVRSEAPIPRGGDRCRTWSPVALEYAAAGPTKPQA